MNHASSITWRAARKYGFTLAELLAVLVIMGILIAAVVPSLSGLTRSASQRSATLQVRATLVQARQFAISRRITTSVLFPTQGNNTNTGNRAIAVYASVSPNGYFVTDWQFMPPGVVLTTTNLGTVIWDPMIFQNGYQTQPNIIYTGAGGAGVSYPGMMACTFSSSGQIGNSTYGANQTGQGSWENSTNGQVYIYEGGVDQSGNLWGRPNGTTNEIQIGRLSGNLRVLKL